MIGRYNEKRAYSLQCFSGNATDIVLLTLWPNINLYFGVYLQELFGSKVLHTDINSSFTFGCLKFMKLQTLGVLDQYQLFGSTCLKREKIFAETRKHNLN